MTTTTRCSTPRQNCFSSAFFFFVCLIYYAVEKISNSNGVFQEEISELIEILTKLTQRKMWPKIDF